MPTENQNADPVTSLAAGHDLNQWRLVPVDAAMTSTGKLSAGMLEFLAKCDKCNRPRNSGNLDKCSKARQAKNER